MGLKLQTVAPRRGLHWLRQGFAETLRRPLPYAGLFAVFMLAVMLLGGIPVLGGPLLLMAVPLLSLGFMMATAGAQRGMPVHAGVFVAPWRGTPGPQRRALLKLCMAYALGTVLELWLCDQIDGGKFDELLSLASRGEVGSAEWHTLANSPGVVEGMVARAALSTLLSLPFWHAPALVQWGGHGMGQALFSSWLAVWRARGAFMVYGVAWMAVCGAAGLGLSLLLSALGLGGALGLVVMPLALLFTTAFYVSLYFSFVDSFGADS